MDTEEKSNEIASVEEEEITTENIEKESTTENVKKKATPENAKIEVSIENAETKAEVENAEKTVTAKSPMNLIEELLKSFNPARDTEYAHHDQICPNCHHYGMKQAGGINRVSKLYLWKCVCSTSQSDCACRYGWK